MVAYLGRPEWPVLATLPRNEFEVVDQEVGYLGTLRTTARVEEADLGYGLWMVVQDFRVVDEAANASRELAAKYGSPPPFRTALLVLEEPQ